ncbi:hypothetical protein TELCIR_06807 [Teladorsagia circumcincta]|uniref:Uncharacterized protein n=1 Tax=Teladorsagia circumcincta TaxID=45464 RepID=A0A2G9UM18_TELCI|nr:hypothetical protein TELCIR_06807 [Teladorsagia circumcincta]
MQWVFVHHLFRNETVLDSCGLLKHLQQSNAYFDELNKLRQDTSNNNATTNSPVEFDDQHATGDTVQYNELCEGAALLEKMEKLQDKAKDGEPLNKETIDHLIDVAQKSLINTGRVAAKWMFVYQQCRRRLENISSQLDHVEELSNAITSLNKMRKKTLRSRMVAL